MDVLHNGWLLMGVGIALRYLIARRRFNRRGVGGLQHFRSFERGIVTTFAEWVLRWAAWGLIVYGCLALLSGLKAQEGANKQAVEHKK